jgi:hypothetical protein
MKKTHIAFVMAATVSVAPLVMAKPAKDPLADVIAGSCTETPGVPDGTALSVSWGWENGTTQTRFGGDAEYIVSYSEDGGDTWEELGEVEFPLKRFEEGMPEEAYWGNLVYSCDPAEVEVSGSCNAQVEDVEEPIAMAVEEYFGGEVPEGISVMAELEGVNVKAMNPGKGKGHQKYPLVDVCGEDAIEIF